MYYSEGFHSSEQSAQDGDSGYEVASLHLLAGCSSWKLRVIFSG